MRTLAKSLCVRWPSVNARAGQILCVPTIKLKFGKYFGKTPDEIVHEDRSYLVWLSNNAERLDKDTIEAIAVALKK